MPRILFLCTGNYYRSRFAEELCNAIVREQRLGWVADSAGLAPECHTRNVGPISVHALAALEMRGVVVAEPHRSPKDVTLEQLTSATRVIALCEREHRVLVRERFAEWE